MSDWPMQNYLDVTHMGTIEALLARTAEPIVGIMRDSEGPGALTMSRVAWETVDVTIDNCRLHSDSDLPVFFCVTGSQVVNIAGIGPKLLISFVIEATISRMA